MNISAQLQALLFSEGGSVSRKRLQNLLNVNETALESAAQILADNLRESGLALIRTQIDIALVIAADAAQPILDAHNKELDRDIGEAALEVLSIILYRGPSTRAHIDFIRGVNTSSTVRNLMARGLIERTGNPSDGREFLYRPTPELLAHLGILRSEDLPEYATISSELANFEQRHQQKQHAQSADTMHDGGTL